MATLYDLAMQYLNQSLPKTFKYDRTPPIGINPPTQPGFPGEPIAKILPVPGGGDNNNLAGSISPMDLSTDFSQITSDRQKRLSQDPTGLNKFLIDTLGMKRPQTAEDIVNLGYRTPSKFGIGALLPDKYGELPRADQAFIASRMGYTGPTVFGENNSGLSKDPFGLNTRSGFGNYAERVGVEAEKALDNLNRLGKKYGAKWDDKLGTFVGEGATKANQMTSMIQAKRNFYTGEDTAYKGYQDQVQNVLDADKEFSTEGDSSNYGIDGYPTYDIKDIQGEDDEEFDPTDPLNLNTTTAPGFMNFYNPYERDNIVDVQRTKDAIEEAKLRDLDAMDPNPNTDNKGFDPGVTPGESGFIGLDKDMDIDIRDIDGPGTYDGPGISVNNPTEAQAYGSCFIAGTKISMADGTLKNIEDIIVGDKVKGHKEENTVIKLDPTLLANRKLYSFNDNEHYFFTSEHPFMTEEGWKSIKPEKTKERDGVELYNQLKGELKIGDKLVTENGLIEIKNIKSKEMNNLEMPLYNFNVSNDNSYIADKYIVHNKGNQGSADPKIVCTMMNQSYGFGSFRNKIWKKFHKDLSPEYQKGYHKLFLPLVRIAKTNKVVKKILEHIAVHSTIDMRQATRGKMHLLGRIYRKILLPLCYFVGKHG